MPLELFAAMEVLESESRPELAYGEFSSCDRCGAQAYVRVLLPSGLELLFCTRRNRQHASALANMAVEIQAETIRLACCALCEILAIGFANRPQYRCA
jgi:hypothetical protein